MTNTLKGTALVTGGGVRVGKAICLALAENGWNIALHYHTSEQEAQQTAEEVKATGRNCELFSCDLNDGSKMGPLLDEVFSKYPDCNLLVNNASIFEKASFADTNEDLFDRHMNINFKAPFFLTQSFAQRCQEGQVINMLDTYVTRNTVTFFAYMLSKKALYEFTRMSARELGPEIRVNGLAIGNVLPSNGVREEDVKQKEKILPLRKRVELTSVTQTLLDVIHNPSLTGQIIFIDSGEQLL